MRLKFTVTSLFMVPPLKVPKEWLTEWEGSCNFLNAYSYEAVMSKNYEDCIYLLFKPKPESDLYLFIEQEYSRTDLLVEDLEIDDFVVMIYKLNNKWENDYQLIRDGKYSETSKMFQDEFSKVKKIKVNGLHRDELTLQTRIFAKSTDVKQLIETELDVLLTDKQEVWGEFNTKRETLTYDVLGKYK